MAPVTARVAEGLAGVPADEGLAEIVEPAGFTEAALRDRADQPILASLAASGADWLVTGDRDLLALAGSHRIVTPAGFWERHG